MEDKFIYDVFLSHSTKDKAAAGKLAARLKRDGLKVRLAESEIKRGERSDTKQKKIERALDGSRALILCLSRKITAVEWDHLERQTTRFRDPVNAQRRFIPLRLDDAEINQRLGAFECLDWRAESGDQYARLLSACRTADSQLQLDSLAAKTISEKTIALDLANRMSSVAFSEDGKRVIATTDSLAQLHDLLSSSSNEILTITPTAGKILVSGAGESGDEQVTVTVNQDKSARVWDVASGHCLAVLEHNAATIWGVALNGDGGQALSGDHKTVRLWDVRSGRCVAVFEGHTSDVLSVAFSGNRQRAVSGSRKDIRVWDLKNGDCLAVFKGHTHNIWGVALSANGQLVLSGSTDRTIRVWDVPTERCVAVLEGHTDHVHSVALSEDGGRALSRSCDNTVRVWDVVNGRRLAILDGGTFSVQAVAFIDDAPCAFSWPTDGKVQLRTLEKFDVPTLPEVPNATRYTNAKVVFVGQTGVGKTGLAMRLCEDRWEPTESTHGMIISPLRLGREAQVSDIDREVWIWDFAGQPDYRLIHQLYMDETALGILVFDPQDDHPFEELRYWEKALQKIGKAKGITPPKLLVAARCDRGGITLSKRRFNEFCKAYGFAGLWLTAAKTGDGCEDLKTAIVEHIPWDQLPWITTTQLFKSLKDALLKLKEEDAPLVRLAELRQRMQLMLPTESISSESLRTVVGLMEGQGVLKTLDFGGFVLLQPEHINRYGAVVVRMAREHEDEMGVVPEQDVLDGRLDFKNMTRLPDADEQMLLRAMVQTFLDRALCLRETTPTGTLLVFPSYFRRDKPRLPEYPNVFVTYGFEGALEEIYATLVVKLSYSEGFKRHKLWKDAADFKTPGGRRVGLAIQKQTGGAAELLVYFEAGVPDDTKVIFIKYIHEHLLARFAECNTYALIYLPTL